MQEQAQKLDDLEQRLIFAYRAGSRQRRSRLELLSSRLRARSPGHLLGNMAREHEHLAYRLEEAMQRKLETAKIRFAHLAQLLDSLSPLRTLERGYAIISHRDGSVISAARAVSAGATVNARLASGRLELTVARILPDKEP